MTPVARKTQRKERRRSRSADGRWRISASALQAARLPSGEVLTSEHNGLRRMEGDVERLVAHLEYYGIAVVIHCSSHE